MNQQYGQDGGLFGQKTPARTFSKAPALTTSDIKAIVDGLNRPPFMCNLSLVEFDDKAPLELLELLNKLLGSLDVQHAAVDIQRETQDKTQERIVGYLKVLGYPSDFNPNFQRDVVHGEKRTLQHILHWILTRLPELQRRAYTAKFLVPLEIPDEFLCDDEMVQTFETYKDLQAEFKATHQNVDQIRAESMNPAELKKEIGQLEQEKEQLLTKINLFKNKSNKQDFQQLLEATSKLRKEQEQDAKLSEKESELTNMIDFYEQQVLTVKQRVIDAKKVSTLNLAPDKMLENLRNETRKNRELNNEIIGRELNDKRERLQRIELLLQEPVTTQNELERLTNDVKRLQKDCLTLEDKLKQSTPQDDKLAIFKSSAQMLTKKKEQKLEQIKKLEVEKQALEKVVADKEAEYARAKGGKYLKRDDFRQYAANLRGKNAQYKQMKKVIGEIKNEVLVLNRTKNILQSRAEDLGEFMQNLEKSKGISGYSNLEEQIQGVSNQKEALDNQKDQTLQEITEIVRQIEQEVKDRKQ
jgi:intraflagellar transport protein 81